MTKRKKTSTLSAGEVEILRMLWRSGPVTLSEAQAGLGREIGYTTVQTRLNRLVDKGVIHRTGDRPARYSAAVAQEDVRAGHLDALVEQLTGGSVVPLVAHLVRDRSLSTDELTEFKQLIAAAEQRGKQGRDGKKS